MARIACFLLLILALACPEDQPQKVVSRDLGFTAVFPGSTTTARHTEPTPFGEIEWFTTTHVGSSSSGQICNVEVGTLPPGNQGGANQEEILLTLKKWIAELYPGSIVELGSDRGPGFEYATETAVMETMGVIVLRRGRLHHARGTAPKPTDPWRYFRSWLPNLPKADMTPDPTPKNFVRSFQVDP